MTGKSGFCWWDLVTPEGGIEPVCTGWVGELKLALWIWISVLAGIGIASLQ